MRNFKSESTEPWIIEKCMNFWKDFPRIQDKAAKTSKPLALFGLWSKTSIELHLKQGIIEVLEHVVQRKREKLKEITKKLQSIGSNVLRLGEQKEVIQANSEKIPDFLKKTNKNVKEIDKFLEKQPISQFSLHSQRDLKQILKGKPAESKEKPQENHEDSASIVNVSEELFNLTYKSPYQQDLRQKFLINVVKNKGFPHKIMGNSRESSTQSLKNKPETEKTGLNCEGFLSSRNEKPLKETLNLIKTGKNNSISLVKQQNEGVFIDEYELNTKNARNWQETEFIEKNQIKKTSKLCDCKWC